MRNTPSKQSWLADLPLQRKALFAIGLLLVLFLLTSLVTLHSLRQQESNRRWAIHTYQTLLALDHVQRAAQTLQVGARGYLLTQNPAQLDQVDSATRDLDERLVQLREQTVGDPLQSSRIDELEAIGRVWRREFTRQAVTPLANLKVDATAQGALDRAHIQSTYLAQRTVSIEDMSVVLDQMAAGENRLLVTRNQNLDSALTTTRVINAVAALLGVLLGIMVIRLTLALVTRPLRQLTDLLTRLANHDHDFEIHRLERRDEIGEISRALQVLKQMSREKQEQGWIKEQVSSISHLLLQATTQKEFSDWLTRELVPLCKAGVGLFYLYDDAQQRLELLGSYGLRLGGRSNRYTPGEGLVGQCAVERKAIILDDVPANYLHIDSGSGDALPGYVTIMPVLYRDTLIGVLEMAGFNALSPLNRRLLEELLPIVALALENLNRTLSTHELLLRTREQADDLRVSELVMRQQKEVLRDNNDALHAKTDELEEQSARLIASEEELREQAGELQASNTELRETTDKLARASQYKSEFLANMSHELRTPLNSLLILSRSLADNGSGNLDAEQVESARVIHDAGNSLLHLINDILDLSRVEAGKMELVIDELPLTDLAARLRRTFAHVAVQKGLTFTLEIEPGLPAVLHTDGARLEQITNNLISNAIKFTADGSVAVHISRPDPAVDVPTHLRGQRLIALTVSDTGIGIPTDKFERIFNAFEQVHAGTSRQFGGTGLGLTISQRMTRMLGGMLTVQSGIGSGSRFTVLLPETTPTAAITSTERTPADERTHAHSSQALAPHPLRHDGSGRPPIAAELAGRRVLLVDDDMRNLFALSSVLRSWGMHVALAQDGHKALNMLANEEPPELLLIDIMMPGMDGYAVIRGIRAQSHFAQLPIIALTAKAMKGDREHCLAMGANDYLSKPIDLGQLASVMHSWLQA